MIKVYEQMNATDVQAATRPVSGPTPQRLRVRLGKTPSGQPAASVWVSPMSNSGAVNFTNPEHVRQLMRALQDVLDYLNREDQP